VADLHALFAQGRQGLGRRRLLQAEGTDLAAGAAVVGGDGVDPGSYSHCLVQPLEVAAGGLAQAADEVVQRGVLELVLDQVVVHALAEHFIAQQVAQLHQGRRALRIGDGVDVVESVGGRGHRHLDRVRGQRWSCT
jgi:hypothetical protein